MSTTDTVCFSCDSSVVMPHTQEYAVMRRAPCLVPDDSGELRTAYVDISVTRLASGRNLKKQMDDIRIEFTKLLRGHPEGVHIREIRSFLRNQPGVVEVLTSIQRLE